MAKFSLDKVPGGAVGLMGAAGLVVLIILIASIEIGRSRDAAAAEARGAAFRAAQPSAQAEPVAASTTWFVANSDFTSCFETAGPAARIEAIQSSGREPRVTERTGLMGGLEVEVEAPLPGGLETTHATYYRSKADCDASISQRSSLADRYR